MEPPSLLTPLQRDFLHEFFAAPAGQAFFLTGGTALAEFYLHHRYSEDIDLFTLEDESFREVVARLASLAKELGATFEERVATPTFRQLFIRVPDQPELKIDLVRDVGTQFGEHQRFGNVIVDSLLNIAVNKVTALFGRASGKDFVDLYFLLKQGFELDELMRLAKEKDPGLSEFYFAGMLRQIRQVTSLPQMIHPLTTEELRAFFEPLAEQIMLKAKPAE